MIRIWGPPFDALPQRPALAAAIKGDASWRCGAIQMPVFAQDDYWLEVHVPSLSEATDRVLRASAGAYALSDKGKLGSALRDSADTAVLLEPWMFEVITKLTTPRSRDLLRELQRLRALGAVDDELADLAARWGGRASRRYLSASQLSLPASANASALLERLCQVGWAERGLQVNCPACGAATFIQLSSTSDQATCPGCHSQARYEPALHSSSTTASGADPSARSPVPTSARVPARPALSMRSSAYGLDSGISGSHQG